MSILKTSQVLVNLAKFLLIGSLGFLVFMFIVGMIIIAGKVGDHKNLKKPSVDICTQEPDLGLCKKHQEDF